MFETTVKCCREKQLFHTQQTTTTKKSKMPMVEPVFDKK